MKKEYSEQAQKVLDELSNDEVKQVQWNCPFRKERDAKIKELCDRGVQHTIIAEISGASTSSIGRIAQHGANK